MKVASSHVFVPGVERAWYIRYVVGMRLRKVVTSAKYVNLNERRILYDMRSFV